MPDAQVPDPDVPGVETVSVLLPVHRGADPAHLDEAVVSLLAQTRPADELVVVEDGPLDAAHLAVLDDLERRHPRVVRVALATNRGAGAANQAGLLAASGTWIAKADADDLNLEHRFAKQLALCLRRDVDVLGAAMEEFDHVPEHPVGVRVAPVGPAAVARRMRWNNPVNHPTAFFRRDLALSAGGYPPMRYMQDYVLFARMAAAGAVIDNVPDVLVRFRATGMLARRRARDFDRLELELQRHLVACGIVGRPRAAVTLAVRLLARRLPLPVMGAVHHRLFRRAA